MNTTVNYEFCDDIWGVIKSFMFKDIKSVGDKCDYCDELWNKTLCIKQYDIYNKINGDYLYRENYDDKPKLLRDNDERRGRDYLYKIRSYPYNIEVKVEEFKEFKYLCNKCWNKECMRIYSIEQYVYKEIKKYVGDDKQTDKFYENLMNNDCEWLVKKHRLNTKKNLQAKIIEFIEDGIKKANQNYKKNKEMKLLEYKKNLEDRKKDYIRKFWIPLNEERNNKYYLKQFNQGKINYIELMNSLKK